MCYNKTMLKSIKNIPTYKSLNLTEHITNTYLFYSNDMRFNDEIALTFAKALMCTNGSCCDNCLGCTQFDSNSNPDLFILDQDSIKVEDAKIIIDKLSTKPISSKYKLFVILNADRMNDKTQNKLLKSLEEPSINNIFILTTTKMDKLLPTIISRLKKINLPKLTTEDKKIIANDLDFDISKYYNIDISLTEIMNFNNQNYLDTINVIKKIFNDLNSSADIPMIVNSLTHIEYDKSIFFECMQDIFLDILKNNHKYDDEITHPICIKFSHNAIIQCIPHINKAYIQQMANVNFNYILDNLLFNILKEKYLCS